jgi:hypothetical protein
MAPNSTSLNFHDTIPPKIWALFWSGTLGHVEAWNHIQIGPEHAHFAGLLEREWVRALEDKCS